MPLFVNEAKISIAPSVDEFAKSFITYFKDSSQKLLRQDIKVVGPKNLLYIGQREIGGTGPDDDVIFILGSEDATTCHIGVLRHTGSGATSLIHFDGSNICQGLQSMVAMVKDLTQHIDSGRLEMHLVGGFLDDRQNSHEVSNEVLDELCKSSHDIHLVTATITHFNTAYKAGKVPYPAIYGIACDVKTGDIFRATFPDKGPALALRNARHFTGRPENIVIYEPHSHHLVIEPFHYEQIRNLERIISMPDQLIRENLSTSPEQEPEGFEAAVRASLVQIRDHPNPLTTVFKGGKGRRFHKDQQTGAWLELGDID